MNQTHRDRRRPLASSLHLASASGLVRRWLCLASCALVLACVRGQGQDAADPSLASSSASSSVGLIPLPAAIVATWVVLVPSADLVHGSPTPRCDHSFSSLHGLSLRENQAVPFPRGPRPERAGLHGRSLRENQTVPFPRGSRPEKDEYEQKLFLFGGHGAESAVSWARQRN
jgi:hypothetical protein